MDNLKNALGKSFSAFFPTLAKKVEQIKTATTPQKDLVLVSVYPNGLTRTAQLVRNITDWSLKKSTNFVKEGGFPKVIQYNIKSNFAISTGTTFTSIIAKAELEKSCVIEIR